MPAGVRLTGDWDQWMASLDPTGFHQRLQREIRAATTKNALLVRAEIRRRITQNKYLKNSPLTLAAKAPRTKPLVHRGDLFAAIAHEVLDDFTAFVGLNRKRVGEKAVNIGIVLHDGAVVPAVGDVTRAMRAAVYAKARANLKGRAVLRQMAADRAASPRAPLRKWVIPARRYVRDVMMDSRVGEACRRNWSDAVGRALFGATTGRRRRT